jgi:hypothetical protein
MEVNFYRVDCIYTLVGRNLTLPFLKQISDRSGTHFCRIAKLRLFNGLTKPAIAFNILEGETFNKSPPQGSNITEL